MADTLTVTGKVGPGLTATTIELSDVTEFRVDTVNGMLYVISGGVKKEFEIASASTFTVTVSSNNYTITIS